MELKQMKRGYKLIVKYSSGTTLMESILSKIPFLINFTRK